MVPAPFHVAPPQIRFVEPAPHAHADESALGPGRSETLPCSPVTIGDVWDTWGNESVEAYATD